MNHISHCPDGGHFEKWTPSQAVTDSENLTVLWICRTFWVKKHYADVMKPVKRERDDKIIFEEHTMNILHDQTTRRFYSILDGSEAEMTYRQVDETTLDFNHTYVPPSLRGQGIAERIVQEAVKYAQEHGFGVIPSCSYVRIFFKRHPQYADMVRS
ncbi:hypothetical protein U27_00512 [Candidatus Vecturithrix granuli]|uniref:N-acetyltransferase domain-containing protein n=1 Tax=Vecturithrix granuli TaxID=1499967 RepID=A0A081C7R0_VECG1|nr:hypothetical protein U27_00512 [Candidatus Vecturithrix granuli]